MQRSIVAALLVVAGLTTGCSTLKQQDASYEVGSHPEVGEQTTASVGEVMVTKYDYLARETAKPRKSLEGSFWLSRRSVAAGTTLIGAIAGDKKVYCQPPGGFGSPCLSDSDGDGSFDTAYTINAYGFAVNGTDVSPVPYKIQDAKIQDGFKYELVYQGIEDNVVRIAYREYTDNLARPAYRQDLSYTISDDGDNATFRDVILRIHSADNNEIVYTVKSGF
ncbi:hypothetical protein [Arhodomonas sp. AD133]|uniref:hypothetical protein n=1 Tax=Arhodomonas sp. AD133 TaxID=3415009 RepID=UPI003EB7EE04